MIKCIKFTICVCEINMNKHNFPGETIYCNLGQVINKVSGYRLIRSINTIKLKAWTCYQYITQGVMKPTINTIFFLNIYIQEMYGLHKFISQALGKINEITSEKRYITFPLVIQIKIKDVYQIVAQFLLI